MSLTYDPVEAVAALKRADKQLARVIRKAGEFTMRPERMQSLFHALFRAIVFQQLSGKAASTILARVYALYDEGPRVTPETVLHSPDETVARRRTLAQQAACDQRSGRENHRWYGAAARQTAQVGRSRKSSSASPPYAALGRGRSKCC
jgi:3-methyladenine DNA glycosylase/8-oxoguanine DNA glycosylase